MPDRISRGTIISLIAGIPLVAATTSLASAADDSGGTKKQYKYQLKPGPGGKHCSQCTFFIASGACKLVKGKISPNGYCIAFAPKS